MNWCRKNNRVFFSGSLVEHGKFGKGKVMHLEGDPANKKATVFFANSKEEKQLLLKYAKLKVLN